MKSLEETIRLVKTYEDRLVEERTQFAELLEVHELPPIGLYWGDRYIRPMAEEFGFRNAEELFAKYLALAARRAGGAPVFLSLGAGNCDAEIRTSQLLRDAGLTDFVIECLELNPRMIERGREMAAGSGVREHLSFVEADFNRWKPSKEYTAIIANQVLHHVVELEQLFAEMKRALHPSGFLVTADMIGRNGHQRWPEALQHVRKFWRELPGEYRWNRPLKRYEEEYINHDCSLEGFEGIRAQDVLPLLLRYFDFQLFVGFGNVIDVFVDRSFGHNFDVTGGWDLAFIDRVQQFDEQAIRSGALTPTHMFAALTPGPAMEHLYSRGLAPQACVRHQGVSVLAEPLEIVTAALRPTKPGGMAYSLELSAAGGRHPYTWTADGLPPGLRLTATGALSGTIQTDGDFTPLITLQDSSQPPQTAIQRYTILDRTSHAAPPLTLLAPAEFRPSVVGTPYRELLPAGGGTPPYHWSVIAGSLPAGLSLEAGTGAIAGKPTALSEAKFTIQVSDGGGQSTAKSLQLRIERAEARPVSLCWVPHVAAGGGWSTSILVGNPSPQETWFTLEMRVSGGSEVNWAFDPAPHPCQCHASGHYRLAPHGSVQISLAPAQSEEVSGWAKLNSGLPITGHALFTYISPKGVHSEVTIPLQSTGERKIATPFDNRNGNQTGMALLNLSSARPDAVVLVFWDDNGSLLATSSIPLAGSRHTSFMLAEKFPFTADRYGVVVVRAISGQPILATALRLSAAGVFAHLSPLQAGPET